MFPAPATWWYLKPAHITLGWMFMPSPVPLLSVGPQASGEKMRLDWLSHGVRHPPEPPAPPSARAARAFLFSRLDGGFRRRLSGSNRTSQARSAPPVSKTSDKEHTAAPLGHSEELRVQNSPCEAVPEVIHFCEELPESRPALT